MIKNSRRALKLSWSFACMTGVGRTVGGGVLDAPHIPHLRQHVIQRECSDRRIL